MKKKYLILASLFAIVFTSCTSTSTMDDFTYTYSMENVNNFKIEFQLNSDATYKITQYNFFFDNFEKAKKPVSSEGTLDNEEFTKLKRLLKKSNIDEMKDAYGFDEKTAEDSDILYLIELKQDEKSKFVSINSNALNSFPIKFTELISYTNTIISAKHIVQ